MRRRWQMILLLLGALPVALLAWADAVATSDPLVRRAAVTLAGWPAGAPPVKVLLLSDIHVAGPDMPPQRLARIVAQINDLRPDVVLIAGDLVSDKRVATRRYSMAEATAPLAKLRPRLGTFAVLGNHDHWRDASGARRALKAASLHLLDNAVVRIGPLVIGGLDDVYAGDPDLATIASKMRSLPGPRLLLSHSPDPFVELPPDIGLMLAGHTHCGQISLPLIGPLLTASKSGRRYACGIVREDGKTLIVTAGLGTSMLPLRLGAPPDMWLLELGP